MGTLRWGILGTGWIAHAQTSDLLANGFTVIAVGSRTADAASAFSDELGIRTAHASYEDIVADPQAGLARLLALVGEGREDGLPFLDGHVAELGVTHSVAGNPSRFQTGSISIRADERWRHEMAPGARRLVTAVAWPGLLRHGYLRGDG